MGTTSGAYKSKQNSATSIWHIYNIFSNIFLIFDFIDLFVTFAALIQKRRYVSNEEIIPHIACAGKAPNSRVHS